MTLRAGCLAAALLLAASCEPRPAEPPPRPEEGPTIFVAGEERGYLEPCGCTRPQLGGLARKGSALAGRPLLENGNLVDRPGRLSELKFETFLMAFSALSCRALNLGPGDLTLGLDFLRSSADLAGFPLISANLRDDRDRPVFPAFADFEAAGRPVRAVGLLDPDRAPDHRVADPGATLAEVLEETPADRLVIVLYQGREEGARRLAGRFSRIGAVVYCREGGEPAVLSPRVVAPGDRSRWMVRLGPEPEVVELGEEWPDHPEMVRAMAVYVERLAEEDLLHRMNARAPAEHGGFVGDRACAACHPEAARVHEATRHAEAIETLRKGGRHRDPDCVTCHVVGYGYRSGFTSLAETPALARVGCESCHGPGGDHAEGKPTPRDARASCAGCHNADTDPHFDLERKWAGIRHGR